MTRVYMHIMQFRNYIQILPLGTPIQEKQGYFIFVSHLFVETI